MPLYADVFTLSDAATGSQLVEYSRSAAWSPPEALANCFSNAPPRVRATTIAVWASGGGGQARTGCTGRHSKEKFTGRRRD